VKIFVLPPREDWIIDRLTREWNTNNPDVCASSPFDADIIWLFADFCWKHLPIELLQEKIVVTTVHHIVPSKFNDAQKREFVLRDQVTDTYHVPNIYTHDFIRSLTTKPIYIIPYWANSRLWRKTGEKIELRKKYKLPFDDTILVGSFQRDTEGHDLVSPKLEKGPDLFVDAVTTWQSAFAGSRAVEVVLAGWRRQYVIQRLSELNIKYHYFERARESVLNDLYQTLDIYPVTSRYEGGPQSLIECGLLNVPVVSRLVGMADVVLPPQAINDNVTLAVPTVPNVAQLDIPIGHEPYLKLFKSLC